MAGKRPSEVSADRHAYLAGCQFEDATRDELDILLPEYGRRLLKWQMKGVERDEVKTFESLNNSINYLRMRFCKLRDEVRLQVATADHRKGEAADSDGIYDMLEFKAPDKS